MKPRNSCERSSSRSSKDGARIKDAARHSSPILRSMQLSGDESCTGSYSLSGNSERSAKLNLNRSSNGSDVTVPGQTLHTDSGISSSDSLSSGERRSQSPDLVTELLRIAEVKLSEISSKEDLSARINNSRPIAQSSKHMMPPSSIPTSSVVLPVTANIDSDITASMSSIFMTAMDSEVPVPKTSGRLSDSCTSGSYAGNDSSSFTATIQDVDFNDSRLYCSACGDILNTPRLLPCLHTFCTDCLQERVEQRVGPERLDLEVAHPPANPSFSTETLACPTCSAKVDLSLEGIYELPINHMIQRLLVLHNLHVGRKNDRTCDLCPDCSPIVGHCTQCRVNMCEFCLQAHRRQSLTAAHVVIKGNEIDTEAQGLASCNLKKHRLPMMCQRHTSEELRLYCLDCSQLVCRDCCLGSKHKDHHFDYLNHVIDRKTAEITSEFKSCETRIHSLVRAISYLEKSEKIIDDTADEVAGKIERHIESYIRSLQKHKRVLLASVDAKAKAKKESVQSQKEALAKILKDISHSCDFTSQLLTLGNQHEILSLKPYVLQKLQQLSRLTFSENPISVDNFIEFRANKKVKTWIDGDTVGCLDENKRSSKLLRPGLEVDICGDVVSHTLEPKKCTAHGEGVHCSRVKLPSEFIVVAKNFGGEKLEAGGHDISVSLEMDGVDQNLFKKPKIQVTDRQDGTYRILYIVYAAGNYQLNVQISGQHIHSSPFNISAIDSKTHVHSGIFHCCCFCSSGGDRNSTCACGAVMPGGYKGCGHGHEGHPGMAHWSCCGKTTEVSTCGRQMTSAVPVRFGSSDRTMLTTQRQTGRHSHTLPTRHLASRDILRQTSGSSDEMYATPTALRSQRAAFEPPTQYFSRQQNAQTSPNKQVKTVTL